MTSYINIVPADVVIKSITSFTVNVNNIVLFTSASIMVGLWDNKNTSPVSVKYIEISGQEYLQWNNNDEYIVNLVAEKMGFTLLNSSSNTTSIVPTSIVPIPTLL